MASTEGVGTKRYIGDSVYVLFDGFGFWLTTENGLADDPSNKIYLEHDTLSELLRFVDHIKGLETRPT